jgi:hypothetical protein
MDTLRGPKEQNMREHKPEAEFWDEIQTKVLRVFPLAFHSHLYSFALKFIFLQTHATYYMFLQTYTTSYIFLQPVQYTVTEKGGKPDRKPYSLPYGLRNPYRNLKSKNSQDYAQEPLPKLYVHEFGFFTW